MGRFSVAQAVGTKRRPAHSAGSAAPHPLKVPKAGEVALTAPVTRGTANQGYRSLPLSAPVNVCLYKTTDCAADVWDAVSDDVPLYQVQIEHGAQRAITFQMRDLFTDFLREARADNDALPTTMKELEDAVGVRLVVADRQDPDGVGFHQWRVAFYVAGDLNTKVV